VSAARAALVPGVLALLPSYAGQVDPVADLRAACEAAVAELVAGRPERVLVVAAPVSDDNARRGVGEAPGRRVACHLLGRAGYRGPVADDGPLRPGDALLLAGNGSACRSEKAPGHLDERALGFDEALARTVEQGAPPPDDEALAEELWCFDLLVFRRLHESVSGEPDVRYADDPYGVAYWVAMWPGLREEPA
jgi:hypothetical protein